MKLGPTLYLALPAVHAFTGCDYTTAFFNKGKGRPFNIFSKNLKIQQAFRSLTNPNDIFDEKKIEVVHEFTCLMYGIKNCQSVNVARFLMFSKMYATTRNNEKFMKNIKDFDSTHIPPCWKSFKQKLLRTIFVNSMWQNATEPDCIKFSAENCDWILDGFLKPHGSLETQRQSKFRMCYVIPLTNVLEMQMMILIFVAMRGMKRRTNE
jgi:hypothetical protein